MMKKSKYRRKTGILRQNSDILVAFIGDLVQNRRIQAPISCNKRTKSPILGRNDQYLGRFSDFLRRFRSFLHLFKDF